MIYIIYYFIGTGTIVTLLNFVRTHSTDNPDIFYIMMGIATVALLVWGGVLIDMIKENLERHLNDFNSIENLKSKKQSYQSQMDAYKDEMKEELLEKYKKFEEMLMKSITDSKIIATILEKSGYASVLGDYNIKISGYLESIHMCDREIQDKIKDMKVRQNNPIYGFSKFIPRSILYTGDKP
jgi:hypothetical protein